MLIYAALDGIKNNYELRSPVDIDLNKASGLILEKLDKLPSSLKEAKAIAKDSDFVKKYIPDELLENYLK